MQHQLVADSISKSLQINGDFTCVFGKFVRNCVTGSKTNVKNIKETINEAKRRCAGHVARRDGNKRTKSLTAWQQIQVSGGREGKI